jgi:hypothetical protein
VGIDADEGDQHVGILRGDLEHLVVAVAAKPGFALRIDRKDYGSDFPGPVVGSGLRHGRRMLVGRLEVLGHLRLEIVIAVVAMHAAGLLGMGVDVDRHDIFDIGQRQSGHIGSLRKGRLGN